MDASLSERLRGASLDAYPLHDGRPRGAVVVCPGGGYSSVSPREGEPVARAFNRAGYHAFVLRYSCAASPLGWEPLRQLSRAVALIRSAAAELSIDPADVSVCGFSAGGHLAASLGVFWNDPERFAPGTELEAHRPDALVLAYPVISSGDCAHRSSFERLAGPDRAAQEAFSLERFAGAHTPPTFLWHTAEDRDVPIRNSLLFFEALLAAGVSAELHVFPRGVHGLSLATPDVAEIAKDRYPDARVAGWFDLAVSWLADRAALRGSSSSIDRK